MPFSRLLGRPTEARAFFHGPGLTVFRLSAPPRFDVVAVPSMAAGEALVYDRPGCYLVVAEDFRVTPSRDYAPAYQRDSVALRVSGQFTTAQRSRH